ncbi:MAG: endoribonuclease [Amycolatopsis sp.]|nr:endoribonuclease [Amycolatopsis sp.]
MPADVAQQGLGDVDRGDPDAGGTVGGGGFDGVGDDRQEALRVLPKVDIYRQVAVATGSKLVFIAGQIARDADGGKVGEGDFAAQAERCYLNIGTALAEVGGSFDNVVKLTVYLVDWTPAKMPLLRGGGRPGVGEVGRHADAAAHRDRRRRAGRARRHGRGRGHRGPRLTARRN